MTAGAVHFKLRYSGSPGNVTAKLLDEAESLLATITGLKDEKAARAWARKAAAEVKEAAKGIESKAHNVYVSIDGHDDFNL